MERVLWALGGCDYQRCDGRPSESLALRWPGVGTVTATARGFALLVGLLANR